MKRLPFLPLILACLAAPAAAQLALPSGPVGEVLSRATGTLDQIGDRIDKLAPIDAVRQLAAERLARLTSFTRANRAVVELDEAANPARRGVVLAIAPDAATLARAAELGFTTRGKDNFGNLGLETVELGTPDGMPLIRAMRLLREEIPEASFTADQIHFQSGTPGTSAGKAQPVPAAGKAIRTPLGMIDGGVGPAIAVAEAKGFAAGAPRASDHGTAVASLAHHAGIRNLYAADVYGDDPAGGSALAIVRALDWLVGKHVPVVTISLAGPANPLLARAVASAGSRGTTILAAVGNDGPAAPPAYPASYPGVFAITGVDGRNRALIEAGKPLHLDYAAPGADMKALDARGRGRTVRGTSFAAPLAAARVAAQIDAGRSATLRAALDAEARDLGRKGADAAYGRGLLCETCRLR